MFKVINGYKKETIKLKREIQKQAYNRIYLSNRTSNLQKCIWGGVKYFSRFKYNIDDYEELIKAFMNYEYIKDVMRLITFKQFINLFPIEKSFDGYKWECKDYWSTMDYLKDFDLNDFIGENVDELLSNYYNSDIINFCVMQMLVYDRIARMQGNLGLMEQFLNEVDPECNVHMYTYHEKEGYMYDTNTGKTFKVSKPKKKTHLKLVKDTE